MTLTKTKPKRSTVSRKRRTAQHHKKDEHYLKAYWPYVPIVAIMLIGLLTSNWVASMHRSVLGYATDMSVSGLLTGTNNQRIANGLGSLALNSLLNNAAQTKANDMAARNYWSHNTPDGTPPWTFITDAGYLYATAGENLAYGFTTSDGTITGWMNSPGHRANILNTSFTEVGFGIINIADYQSSGPQTLVVAMYASPRVAAAPAPAPAPIAPQAPVAKQPVVTPVPTQPQETPLTTETPAPENVPAPAPVASQADDTVRPTPKPLATTTVKEPEQKKIVRLQLVASNWAPSWSLFATSLIVVGGLFFLVFRWGFAWHKVLIRSERFILHHPLLDIAVVTVVTISLVLSQTSGLIR